MNMDEHGFLRTARQLAAGERFARLPSVFAPISFRAVKPDGARVDGAWRKSRLAARLLIRKEAGALRPREQALARLLSRDPEVSNRLIQQALYFLGVGPHKHAFDEKLVGRRN